MTVERTSTLLVSCPDRKGLVAALAQLLYGFGLNLLDSEQHSDEDAGVFFQRIRFDRGDPPVDRVALEEALGEVAGRFEMSWRLSDVRPRKKLAILVSRFDHCLYDLLLRQRAGELPCELSMILSNHEELADIGRRYEIPFHVHPVSSTTREAAMSRMIERLEEAGIDLVVLARYMQVLSPEFCRRFAGRVINIHHSFLPAFVGGRPYHQAHRRGVKVVGATAHYATPDLDEGPIIEQDVIRVTHRDSVADLVRKGRDLERLVLSRAVRAHLEDRVLVYGNKTVVFG